MKPAIRLIETEHDPLLLPMLEMYIDSFGAPYREPVRDLLSQIRTQNGAQHWVIEQEGQLIGMARGLYLPTSQTGYIVHVAIDPSARGKGLGAELLSHTNVWFRGQGANYKGLIVEVERIEDSKSEDQEREARKRLSFFNKLGGLLITPGYTQPSMGPGLPPVPLNLILIFPEGSSNADELIRGYYADGFGLDETHEFVKLALSHARNPLAPLHSQFLLDPV